ncbi:mitochondrial import receptor subunit TOM20 homolog B [Lates japonicus]|uniref:Mitochondrial import receptor subunit TOM20 homolog B n=1 Tax=Lates japonicus TaxID=270547 RepID=A0AAD3RJY2_LATJO|nr:mitochondrial import receptor subunit TOM20 homolog B [Lates japonicus]
MGRVSPVKEQPEGVDESCSIYAKRRPDLPVIHKHPHPLRTRLRETPNWRAEGKKAAKERAGPIKLPDLKDAWKLCEVLPEEIQLGRSCWLRETMRKVDHLTNAHCSVWFQQLLQVPADSATRAVFSQMLLTKLPSISQAARRSNTSHCRVATILLTSLNYPVPRLPYPPTVPVRVVPSSMLPVSSPNSALTVQLQLSLTISPPGLPGPEDSFVGPLAGPLPSSLWFRLLSVYSSAFLSSLTLHSDGLPSSFSKGRPVPTRIIEIALRKKQTAVNVTFLVQLTGRLPNWVLFLFHARPPPFCWASASASSSPSAHCSLHARLRHLLFFFFCCCCFYLTPAARQPSPCLL